MEEYKQYRINYVFPDDNGDLQEWAAALVARTPEEARQRFRAIVENGVLYDDYPVFRVSEPV
jgi:hypothetical protein